MRGLTLAGGRSSLELLCIGAHSDDIEIGLGGTILGLIESGVDLRVHWCVCSAEGQRADEARASATDFLAGAREYRLHIGALADSYFPSQARDLKHWLAAIREQAEPDIVFTHQSEDAHQDHRQVSEATWNLFRDHMILEYEIPKWDGDLTRPNMYVALTEQQMERKAALLKQHFGTQRSKDWFDADTFKGLARIRGMECRASERYAEAFHMKKGHLLLCENRRDRHLAGG
jgi:LmbE family N-acetylglucosaminyl deacetylase